MPFAYYDRLSNARKRTYRKSDAIRRIDLADVAPLLPLAAAIGPALETEKPREVERACQALVDAVNARMRTPPVAMRVLARRPASFGSNFVLLVMSISFVSTAEPFLTSPVSPKSPCALGVNGKIGSEFAITIKLLFRKLNSILCDWQADGIVV